MTDEQRYDATQWRRLNSGAVLVLALSLVFLVVAVAFVILGALALSIESPNHVLGIGMLIGAAVVGIACLMGIAYGVRKLRHPRLEA